MKKLMICAVLLALSACSKNDKPQEEPSTPPPVEQVSSTPKPADAAPTPSNTPSPTSAHANSGLPPEHRSGSEWEYPDSKSACQAMHRFAQVDSEVISVQNEVIKYKLTLTNQSPLTITQALASIVMAEKGKPHDAAIACDPVAAGFMNIALQPKQSISQEFEFDTKQNRCRANVLSSQGNDVKLIFNIGKVAFDDESEITYQNLACDFE